MSILVFENPPLTVGRDALEAEIIMLVESNLSGEAVEIQLFL